MASRIPEAFPCLTSRMERKALHWPFVCHEVDIDSFIFNGASISCPIKCWGLSPEDHERIVAEVRDTILGYARERFSFTNHLVSATFLQGDRFEQYKMAFPEDALNNTLKAYPMLSGNKLKTELSLIYSKEEFKACRGAVDLFQLFMENNLEEVFSETVTLLKIPITTPMTTAEAERCFSTLKRIKTFLTNTMTQTPGEAECLGHAVNGKETGN